MQAAGSNSKLLNSKHVSQSFATNSRTITGSRLASISQQTSAESSPAEISLLEDWQSKILLTPSLQANMASS